MLIKRGVVSGVLGAAVAATAIIGAGALVQPAQARADEGAAPYQIDAVHSAVMFRIQHQGVAYSYGRFNTMTGSYNIDLTNPSASMIDITVDANSVDTANERRDNHLRSPDFFNAKQFPTITFKSQSFEKTGDSMFKVRGELTMLGVTKPIDANLVFVGEAKTKQGAKSGFECNFTIKRSEFGMTKYLEDNALGDEVTLYVAIEGVRK